VIHGSVGSGKLKLAPDNGVKTLLLSVARTRSLDRESVIKRLDAGNDFRWSGIIFRGSGLKDQLFNGRAFHRKRSLT
jgi:hypothetical protein